MKTTMETTRRQCLTVSFSGATILFGGCAQSRSSDADKIDIIQIDRQSRSQNRADLSSDLPGSITQLQSPSSIPSDWSAQARNLDVWIAATDFANDLLVSLETAGPTTCYQTIKLNSTHSSETEYGTRMRTIEASASAQNERRDGQVTACGDRITPVVALLRVPEEERTPIVRVVLTDGWDRTTTTMLR